MSLNQVINKVIEEHLKEFFKKVSSKYEISVEDLLDMWNNKETGGKSEPLKIDNHSLVETNEEKRL